MAQKTLAMLGPRSQFNSSRELPAGIIEKILPQTQGIAEYYMGFRGVNWHG